MTRTAEIARRTKETDVALSLTLDGSGAGERLTGVGFLDHMLDLLARHGRLDLHVNVTGDLHTGAHHTAEDTGLALGVALDRALGDRAGIVRYGHAVVPMDEARASCSIDVSGRPLLVFAADRLPAGITGGFDHELAEEFFRAVTTNARLTVHLTLEAGTNAHHMIEALFKAFARALRAAVAIDPTETGVPSTKGTLTAIAIVDYGMGNRRSVEKALERVGGAPRLTGDHAVLRAAGGLVVPGVGAFPEAMRRLRAAGLDELVRERAGAGVPVLGLCLGMQLLLERSEEHEGAEGLGLIPGDVRRLDARGLKLPHIGWNEVRWTRRSPLVAGLADAATFYHVHSFVPHPADEADVLGRSDYGSPFATVLERGRVCGAQFHPEKSSRNGLALLRNFAALCGSAAVAA